MVFKIHFLKDTEGVPAVQDNTSDDITALARPPPAVNQIWRQYIRRTSEGCRAEARVGRRAVSKLKSQAPLRGVSYF